MTRSPVPYPRFTVPAILMVAIFVCLSEKYQQPAPILRKRNYGGLGRLHLGKRAECQAYVDYSTESHEPFTLGELHLPFQRPPEHCRTYKAQSVERVISDFKERLEDPDLSRLFENCLPNTLDTTILWHKRPGSVNAPAKRGLEPLPNNTHFDYNDYVQTFIVTGDIHAEWLRDSTWQLSVYQKLAKYDQDLQYLIRGAINTQARLILQHPYCNAFQPPPEADVQREDSAVDSVFPEPNWDSVFECKYELDSLASFFALSNHYYEQTRDESIFNDLWKAAAKSALAVLNRESNPTFDGANLNDFPYSFQRETNIGSETLPLSGSGNPVSNGTGLVRSAFRPSDDACVFQLFIPANAYLATELRKLSSNLQDNQDLCETAQTLSDYAKRINESIYEYGVFDRGQFGKVFAYEVDGYGSAIFMDDANIPSLLSLPDLGFVDVNDEIYQNTRKMILSNQGNPYYLSGANFRGIGGPHVGYKYAWPMSLLVKIRTSDDDLEILDDLNHIKKNTGFLGLMHEGINVNVADGADYTRPWFAWCNSEFAKTILDLAERKPHLIFKEQYVNKSYNIDNEFGR